MQVFKSMNGLGDMSKSTLFSMKDVDKELRGHNLMIQKRYACLNIRKYNFTYRVVDTCFIGLNL